MLKLIPSTSLAALTTRALLMCARRQCQRRIRLFWLTRCVGHPRHVIAIVFWLMVAIVLLGRARLSMNRFFLLLANAIISPFFIKLIRLGHQGI